MTLHLYFARRFGRTFLGMTAIFAVLFVMIRMVELLREFDRANVTFGQIVNLTLLSLPAGLYRILPLIMILSTLALFLSLARSSELVVTRAAGRSAVRTLMSPIIVALLIGIVGITAINPIVAATTRQYDVLANRMKKGGGSVMSIDRNGLWLRQGDETGQTVINAARTNPDATELYDVTFIGFGPDGLPSFRIAASRAELTSGAWVAHDVKEWRLDTSENPEKEARETREIAVPTNLTPNQIREGFSTPATIPFWDLPRYIENLKQAGFSARRHMVWLQIELAQPLLLVAMVLIGASFTMRHTRFGRTGMMVLLALLMGFGTYFIRNLAQILGENGEIPVVLAAWAPPVAAIFLAMGLLLHMEDG